MKRNKEIFPLSNDELHRFFNSFTWEKEIKGKREYEYLHKIELKKVSIIMYDLLPKSTFEIGNWQYTVNGYRIQRYNKTKIVETNPILSRFRSTKSL